MRIPHIVMAGAVVTLLVGCTTLGTATPPPTALVESSSAPSALPSAPILSLAPQPSVLVSVPPSTESSEAPSSEPTSPPGTATPGPTKTPKPTPRPTQRPTSTPADLPNLIISNASYLLPWHTNTDEDLTVTVKNTGTQPAGAFYVHAQAVSSDGKSTYAFIDQQVPSLAPGATMDVHFNANLPTADTYKLTFVADIFKDVAESDEKDNSAHGFATVTN